tara:strand:- start:13557 stop:13694 length:138 start_codon:yes stop_codon:yes gene_type:complete
MIHLEFAFIKGFCLGMTIDNIEEIDAVELRLFLVFIYIGIVFDNE